MAAALLVLPIQPGQADAARAFARECLGPRYKDFDTSERRLGIPAESWYVLHSPSGEKFAIYVEANDVNSSVSAFIASQEPFDLWFKQQMRAITGYGFDGPPPDGALAETVGEYSAR